MPGRRSLTGIGHISLIYTLGMDDGADGQPEHAMTASVGEDFAECSWPVSIKCQAGVSSVELTSHLEALADAIDEGFWMTPGSAPTLYWRWTGAVPPGMNPDGPSVFGSVDNSQALGTGRRSEAGSGTECGIYLMDKAEKWNRPDFYGRIQGNTAVSSSVGEDFAVTHWPVVVKVKPGTTRAEGAQFLRDGAMCIRDGLFVEITGAAA